MGIHLPTTDKNSMLIWRPWIRPCPGKFDNLHRLPEPASTPSTIDLNALTQARTRTTRCGEAVAQLLFDGFLGPLALQLALFVGVDEAMDDAVVADPLFLVVLAFLFRLGPGKAVEFRVSLAAGAVFARVVTVLLDEPVFARVALIPLGVLG